MVDYARSRRVARRRFVAEPELMIWQSRAESLAMAPEEVENIQLLALQRRFEALKKRIPVLRNLANEQSIDKILTLEDGARLLFKHSVYKSYPLSLLQKAQFSKLTEWLGNFSTLNLSAIDASEVSSIDEWLDLLNVHGVRILHSTGTSGKLSFLARSEAEQRMAVRTFRLCFEQYGEALDFDKCTFIVPAQRIMYNGYGMTMDAVVRHMHSGDESRILTLDQGRLSADMLSLAGRLSAPGVDAAKELSLLSPTVRERRKAFLQEAASLRTRRANFFTALAERLKGKRVIVAANWSMLYEMAEQGLAEGLRQVFAPDSLILSTGGAKGRVLPSNYQKVIRDFLGVESINEGFGMVEMTSLMPKCPAGNYHAMPWMILYLLDGRTGEVLPREGAHVGRFGIIDLAAQTYWGGFLSGDEVKMGFDCCACGAGGPYIEDSIRRYGIEEGGDDKITCAGVPEAHSRAIAFLNDYN